MGEQTRVRMDRHLAQRLKIYAADSGVSLQELVSEIAIAWLERQPLVGGVKSDAA